MRLMKEVKADDYGGERASMMCDAILEGDGGPDGDLR